MKILRSLVRLLCFHGIISATTTLVSAFPVGSQKWSSAFSAVEGAAAVKGRNHHDLGATCLDRRSALVQALAGGVPLIMAAPKAAQAEDTGVSVRGIELTPFNGLIFQYRGNDFGGIQASDLNEPSVSYREFVERLKAGQVARVEFMAPDGDVAYVTFKASPGQAEPDPIRIGEGYPVEQHDGYSSPAFAIRTVQNAGVPYQFTVPYLQKYKNQSR